VTPPFTMVAMATSLPEPYGPVQFRDVREPDDVTEAWVEAWRVGRLLTLQVPTFTPMPEPGDLPVYAGTPRKVTKITAHHINPGWVESIQPTGMETERAAVAAALASGLI
jgi:hypothetical protein